MKRVIGRVCGQGQGIAGIVLLLALMAAPAVAQEARTLTIGDMFALKSVSSPQVSPDGRWVAYTVSHTDAEEGERSSRLWMAPLAGGDPLPMTLEGESVSSPAWSPDGRWLSFLASRDDEKTQVWALDRRGGEAQQLTEVEQGVGGYEWSPDGSRLLLTIRDPEDEAEGEDPGDEGEGADEGEGPEPYVIDRLQFKRDYVGYLDRRRTHLYVYDLESKTLTQLTDGDYDDGSGEWSPDGSRVVFSSNRTAAPDANTNTDLWVVDVPSPGSQAAADSVPVPEPRQLTTNPGADGSPAWSPDGRTIAFTTVTEPERLWYANTYLAVVPAGGGEARVLTRSLDRNVRSPEWGPDGWIWFRIEDSGEEQLARIRADGTDLDRVVTGERVVTGQEVGPGGQVVVELSAPHMPGELFVVEEDGPRQLTRLNTDFVEGVRLGEVRNIHARSSDGTPIEGWVILPPDYEPGRRYPTLLKIHGGPTAQYDWRFSMEDQLFAAHGYVVVKSNPRGSTGYGSDFAHAIYADWGDKPFEDVMAAVDKAIEDGYADPDRLGVGGWSYGGILTNYVITKTGRFEGAITGASEVLYRANYGHDHYQYVWVAELGLPWGETAENWEEISPFNYVENVTTPTLIMGGQIDWNVPILNSEQLYQALKKIGRVPTALVVYPDEHHGIRRPAFQRDRLERWLDWYDLYVKGTLEPDDARAEWEGALERLQN